MICLHWNLSNCLFGIAERQGYGEILSLSVRRIRGPAVSRNPLFRAQSIIDLAVATWMARMLDQILHGGEWNVDHPSDGQSHFQNAKG